MDDEVTNVYALLLDREAEDFVIQKEELSRVQWFDLEDLVGALEAGTLRHCIYPEELELVRTAMRKR